MKNLKYISKHEILGRGTVYVINLSDNNISNLRKEFTKELMGKQVEIDNKQFIVHGIEAFVAYDDYVHNTVGLLVKEYGADAMAGTPHLQ